MDLLKVATVSTLASAWKDMRQKKVNASKEGNLDFIFREGFNFSSLKMVRIDWNCRLKSQKN